MKTKIYFPIVVLIAGLIFTSCNVNNGDDPTPPTIDGVEIGSGNNGQGVIGRDFHFDMDVVAGDLIETVELKIQQRSDEEYSHEWSFEITWDEFAGLKNTNVHKHFDIPEDAPEGHYDFIIIVNDQNGATLEKTREVELVAPENLPVDPYLYMWEFSVVDGPYQYVNETLENPDNVTYANGDVFSSAATIDKVKGDGKMYVLFVKKSADHQPRIVDDIDFSKVIIYDIYEHKNQEEVDYFSNRVFASEEDEGRPTPEFTIGAAVDNNTPEPNTIDGDKGWENGEYYLGIVYTNSTYNVSVYHYVDITIEGF